MTNIPLTDPCLYNNSVLRNTTFRDGMQSKFTSIAVTADVSPSLTTIDTVVLSIIGMIIVIGNGLICFIFYKVRGLRQEPPNILLCNQACADIIIGILFIPVRIFDGYVSELAISPFVLCYCLFVSMFSLCSLSVDRYVAVLQPLRYRHVFTDVIVRWEIAFIWVLPLVMTLVPLSYEFKPRQEQSTPRRIFEVILWGFILVLFLAMVVMYLMVFGNAKRNINKRLQHLQTSVAEKYRLKAQLKLQKKELHVAALFALFMVFFFITYLPILVINCYLIVGKISRVSEAFINASLYSFVVNSVFNPILCILLKKDFKTALLQLVRKRGNIRREEHSTEVLSKGKGSYSKSISTSVGSGVKDPSVLIPLNSREMQSNDASRNA